MVKTADAASVTAGTPIAFTVTVSNTGGGNATGVTLTDALPGGSGGTPVHWTIDGSTGNPASFSISGADGSQHLSLAGQPISMAHGTSLAVHITAATSATSCGAYDNDASVTTTNDSSDEDSASTAVLCPDVSVEKSTNLEEVSAGDSVSYNLTVTAGGTGNSTNVTLTDTLPTGVAWNAPGGADGGACSIAAGVLTCHFGTMAPGASKHVTISGVAGTGACPKIDNSARVTADVDVDSSNNSAGPITIAVDCPDVTILKEAKDATISAGDTAQFNITVTNLGPGTAKDVNVTDTLPAGITWSEDSAYCDIASGVLTCHWDSIEANHGFQIHVSGLTDAADCHELPNTADVTAGNEADEDTGNNESSASITVLCPDLKATKEADASPVDAGHRIGFKISVMNDGDGMAHNVAIDDPLPAGADLNWSIADQPQGNPCSITGAVGAQTLTCSFGDLGSGVGVSVHIVSGTKNADCATYPNIASVTASNNDELNPQADVTVQCPGLNIAKTAASTSINGGDTASFTIKVWNAGPGTALNVTLDDPLPGGLAWTDDSADCSITSGTLHCDFGDLGITTKDNTPAVVTVTAPTTREDCGTLPNAATASADNTDDVQASASIEVTCPVISIVKSNDQPDPVLPGTVVTYSLTVTVADGPANDVDVVDTLPAGLDDPTNISDGGIWSSADRTITWHFDSLPNGDEDAQLQGCRHPHRYARPDADQQRLRDRRQHAVPGHGEPGRRVPEQLHRHRSGADPCHRQGGGHRRGPLRLQRERLPEVSHAGQPAGHLDPHLHADQRAGHQRGDLRPAAGLPVLRQCVGRRCARGWQQRLARRATSSGISAP